MILSAQSFRNGSLRASENWAWLQLLGSIRRSGAGEHAFQEVT